MNKKQIIVLFLVLLAAFVLRAALVMGAGYKQDIWAFKDWSRTAATYGVHCMYEKSTCDYLPGYLYVLKMVGAFYGNFDPAYNFDTWFFNFLVKLPPMLADLLIGAGIFCYLFWRRHPYRFSLLMTAAFVFNPAVIYNSAYWGQIDSVQTLLALLGVMALANGASGWAWGIFTLSILIKPQMVVLLPIFVFMTWRKGGFRELLSGLCASFLTLVAALAPFFYFHQVDRMIDSLLNLVGRYCFLSVNAYNFWWFLLGRDARWFSNTELWLNLILYRDLGNILLAALIALALWYLFKKGKDEDALFLGCGLTIFAFFMVMTEMHERYVVPALAFLLMGAVKRLDLKIVYGLVSATAFLNMVMTLARVYPDTFPRTALFWEATPLDRLIAAANVAILGYFIWLFFREVERKYLAPLLAIVFAAVVALFAVKLLGERPVYLSKLVPVYSTQQWGKLRPDRSVDGRQLAVNGFIYRRGVGTHANSTIIYKIYGRYRSLEGAVGIDDEANRDNKVMFQIYADNKLIYQSKVLRGRQNPEVFFLPLKGTRELKLVVNDGGDGINSDHADWLGMKLLP